MNPLQPCVAIPPTRCVTLDTELHYYSSVLVQPHHPHVLESQVVKVAVDGDTVDLSLWDTVCDDEYERLRPLSYPNANIFIITFAVDDPISLKNVSEKV
jgi:GTPase SAR1 family protein